VVVGSNPPDTPNHQVRVRISTQWSPPSSPPGRQINPGCQSVVNYTPLCHRVQYDAINLRGEGGPKLGDPARLVAQIVQQPAQRKAYSGNVFRQAEMLKQLGVKSSKTLPAQWVEPAMEGPVGSLVNQADRAKNGSQAGRGD